MFGFIFVRVFIQKFRPKNQQIFFVFLLLSVSYLSFFGLKALFVSEEYKAGNNFVYEERMRIYTKGFLGYLKKPLLGYGYANFDKSFEAVDWPTEVPKDIYVDKAHSLFLELLTTTGAMGFTFYLLFLYLIFKKLKRGSAFDLAITLSLLLYISNAQINVTSIAQDVYFWLFAGILTKED